MDLRAYIRVTVIFFSCWVFVSIFDWNISWIFSESLKIRMIYYFLNLIFKFLVELLKIRIISPGDSFKFLKFSSRTCQICQISAKFLMFLFFIINFQDFLFILYLNLQIFLHPCFSKCWNEFRLKNRKIFISLSKLKK